MKKPKAVVLLSGGLDSAVTLYWAEKQGFDCFALIFDYRQRHRREIKAAKKIAALSAVPYKVVSLPFSWGGSALTDKKIEVPQRKRIKPAKKIPSTYVPARNIVFLSIAFSLAEVVEAEKVFIGAHIEDYSGYPDCRPQFLRLFEKAANAGMKSQGIKLAAPLLRYKKSQIIKLGLSLGVPFEHTWSCYQGGSSPCGRCESCLWRKKGFAELGVVDPLLKDKAKKRK